MADQFDADREARLAALRVLRDAPNDYVGAKEAKAEAYKDPSAWTGRNTALQGLFGAGLLADYLQTRKIVKKGDETNPIIGKHGQRVKPEIYFPVAALLHTLAMKATPEPYRTPLQVLSNGIQLGQVGRNLHLGYGFKF